MRRQPVVLSPNGKVTPPLTLFYYSYESLLEDYPVQTIEAHDLGHAMQKVAACLPEVATGCTVWKGRRQKK